MSVIRVWFTRILRDLGVGVDVRRSVGLKKRAGSYPATPFVMSPDHCYLGNVFL